MDIRACERHGIPLFESTPQWLQKAAVSGEKEAQLQLSVYYNASRYWGVLHRSSDSSAFFWQKRAWTRYLNPRSVSYPHEFYYTYPEDSLTADQQYILALDYDLKLRSEAQKMHFKAADRLNEEEFLKLKGMVEESRVDLAQKGRRRRKQERLSIILAFYFIRICRKRLWTGFGSLRNWAMNRHGKFCFGERNRRKTPQNQEFLEKYSVKKLREKNLFPLELDQAQNPEFLGLCKLAKGRRSGGKIFCSGRI